MLSAALFLRQYFLLFIFYGFCGWILESTYVSTAQSFKNKKFTFVNRGFLSGPIVPIYAVCAVIMALTLMPLRDHWYLVALVGMVVSDAVEYFTSWSMELFFHARWWDYTGKFLNIKGRICLRNTLFWAVLSVIFIMLIHPHVLELYQMIPEQLLWPLFLVLLVIFLIDLVQTLMASLSIREIRLKMDHMISHIEQLHDNLEGRNPEIIFHPEELHLHARNFRRELRSIPHWRRRRMAHILELHPVILTMPSGIQLKVQEIGLTPEEELQRELTHQTLSEILTITRREYY